jgi:starch synthase
VVVGSGDVGMERALARLSRQYPDRLACHIGYSEQLGHRIQASADALLVPSLRAVRPDPALRRALWLRAHRLARRRPGRHHHRRQRGRDGQRRDRLLFSPVDGETLAGAIRRAGHADRQPARWAGLQRNGARYDVSWGRKAQEYARRRPRPRGSRHGEFDQSSMRRRPPPAGATGAVHSARTARASYQAARRGRVRANDPFGRPG